MHALSKDSFLAKKEPVILLFHLIDSIIFCRLFLTWVLPEDLTTIQVSYMKLFCKVGN